MHKDYQDILCRIPRPPLWYDNHGVPRFDPFRPELCDVYARYAALTWICCQSCGEKFKVSIELGRFFYSPQKIKKWLPTPENVSSLHYGDPPRHGYCSGNTMNCMDLYVLEFWRRDESFEWKRDKSLEIPLADWEGIEPETSPDTPE